jgi:hypothetical protein
MLKLAYILQPDINFSWFKQMILQWSHASFLGNHHCGTQNVTIEVIYWYVDPYFFAYLLTVFAS